LNTFEFEDKKNNLKAKLEFSQQGGYFSRKNLPCDFIDGTIYRHGTEVCKIQGSWLE